MNSNQKEIQSEKKNKRIAMVVTVVAHSLLILLLLSFTFSQPKYVDKPLESMDVMLGESDEGSGLGTNISAQAPSTTEPLAPATNPTVISSPTVQPMKSSTNTPKVSTTKSAKGDVSLPTKSESHHKNQNTTSTSRTPGVTNQSAKAILGNQNSGNGIGNGRGNGQGNGNTDGIQGSPDGSMLYSLTKRMIVREPNTYGNFTQSGTVKIQIFVNPNGEIIRHRILKSPSEALTELAIKKLHEVKFNSVNSAPPEQQGTITFKFLIR